MGSSDNESANQSNSADLTDTLAAYVALVNREGFIEFARQCEGGLTPDKLVGQKVFDRVPFEARQILIDKLGSVFQTNGIEFIHLPAPANCGNGGAIEIRLVPLVESGKPLQTVAVAFRRTLAKTEDGNRLAVSDKPLSRVTLDELPCERSLKERRLIEAALLQSEEWFRQIADDSLQGILILQHERVVYANSAVGAIADCATQELVGLSLESVTERFVDSTSLELVKAKIKNRNQVRTSKASHEIKVRTAAGRTRWIEVTVMPVMYEGDQAIQAALIDITARKEAENALKDSEEKYRTLVENAQNAIFSMEYDGTLTFLNPVAGQMLGGKPESFIGKNIMELFPPDKAARHLTAVQRVIDGGKGETIENLTELQGQPRWHITGIHPLNGHNGRASSAFLISTDITKRKVAEEKLRESESRYREMADLLPQMIFEFDLVGKFTFVNRAGLELFGRTSEEMERGATIFDGIHPKDHERVRENVSDIAKGGSKQGNEYTAIRSDGTEFPVVAYTSRMVRDGEVVGYRGILVDVTERRRAEELLHRSQEAYRDLVENVDDVLYATDGDLVITYVSPVVKSVLGYDPSELVGRSALSLVYSEDLPTIQAAVQDVLNSRVYPSEYRMVAKTGELRWIRSLSRAVFEGDTFVGVRGVLADVHERKLTEQALQESQKRFERVAKQSREMVWEVNADGLFTYVSQASDEILGYRPDELIGTMHFYDLQPEEEREKFKLASIEQIAKREFFHNQINMAMTKTGRVVWFLTSGAPVVDEFGNLKGYVGADLDITERIEMERDLTIKDRAIASSINALGLADLDGRITYVNDAFVRMWGYSSEELVGIPMTQLAFDPGDVTGVMSAIKTQGQYFGESVAIRKDGSAFDVQVSASLVTDKSGQPAAMLATFIDITERKRNEVAVKISEERFRALYVGSPLPTFTWQRNGSDFVLVDCNDAASEGFDGRVRNYLGLTANKIYENNPECIQDLQLCYENQAVINREMRYVTHLSTGREFEIAVRYSFVPPNFVLVVAEDITQRKLDEEALKMSEEKFRALYNGSPLPMVLFQWKDDDLELVNCNEATNFASLGKLPNLIGSPAKQIFSQEPEFLETLYECFNKRTPISVDYCHQLWDSDKKLYVLVNAAFIPPDLLLVQAQDISERKQMEESLLSVNELLAQERHALLDKNIAIKEVSGQIQEEANQVKQNMQSNMDKLILPILIKLKKKSRESERVDLELIESLMSEISSPFLRDLETKFVQFTPRETEICNMIRNGLQSKEIGISLGISIRTVDKFRQKIRNKLCIDKRETNLTTFLRSITQKR